MIKDSQMKRKIKTKKCKSCFDVVFRLWEVCNEMKLV